VGYTEEELRAVNFLDLTHEDYRQANWALITELVEGKRRQFQIEKQYRRKDGSLIWVSNNVSLVPGTERVPRFIMALSEDITQRKRAEEALRKSEALLHEAQRLARTGSWSWDVLSGKVVSSPENARIYDFQPNEDSAAPEVYFQRIHPLGGARRLACCVLFCSVLLVNPPPPAIGRRSMPAARRAASRDGLQEIFGRAVVGGKRRR
jgi:PAS domain S-box-containing protein